VNERIRAREVRVIDANGDQLGILPLEEARRAAEQRELDLIEVAPTANPPVCRIMDYGKFRYEQRKKQKDAQKKSKQAEIKMLRCRPNTDDHDIDFKMRNARKFLTRGHKVRFTVIFRGPELRHKEIGENQLKLFIEGCKDIATVENYPRMEGRRMTMQLEPRPDVLLKARAEAEAAANAGIAPEPEPEDDSAELQALEEGESEA
jgi:translation initiation factor IF-3